MQQIWLAEAWQNWIPQVVVVVAVVALFALYFLDVISGRFASMVFCAGLITVPLIVATHRALPIMRNPTQMIALPVVVGLIGATGALFSAGASYPGPLLREAWVSKAVPSFSVPSEGQGTKYNIFVEGHLEQEGTVEYDLELKAGDEVVHETGTIAKKRKSVRSGRRRVRKEVESSEHRFSVQLEQPLEEVRISGLDKSIERVSVRVFHGWFPTTMMEIAAGALYAAILLLDACSFTRTHPSHLPIASGFVLMFGWLFFQDATLSQTVQNVLGSAMLAAITGTGVGILASAFFRRVFGRRQV